VLGAEGDENLTRPAVLAERACDVRRRRELDLPGGIVLRPLSCHRCRRPVVGDGRNHQDHVCVGARQRLALEIRRGRG